MKTESTPYAVLDIKLPKNDPRLKNGGVWARFYWSQNGGTYGHQVVCEYNIGEGFKTFKTSGCGYCKKSDALGTFHQLVFGKYIKGQGSGDLSYLGKGHKGGNYFTMSIRAFKNIYNKD